jgi:hypothetical protein
VEEHQVEGEGPVAIGLLGMVKHLVVVQHQKLE